MSIPADNSRDADPERCTPGAFSRSDSKQVFYVTPGGRGDRDDPVRSLQSLPKAMQTNAFPKPECRPSKENYSCRESSRRNGCSGENSGRIDR